MKKSSVCVAALVLSLAAAVGGCKKSNSASGPVAINANCPIMTQNAVSTKADTVEYNGVTIGFCCNECVDDWNGWTDEKKAEFVTANTPEVINKFGDPAPESDH